MNKKALDLFKSLADATGGQILYFHGKSALGRMSNFITKGLIGGTNIPVIQTGRTRRSLGSTEYAITVDNSMDTLSATVMTGTSGSNIQLRNPGKHLAIASLSFKTCICGTAFSNRTRYRHKFTFRDSCLTKRLS